MTQLEPHPMAFITLEEQQDQGGKKAEGGKRPRICSEGSGNSLFCSSAELFQ
jgi:hypothetical protein